MGFEIDTLSDFSLAREFQFSHKMQLINILIKNFHCVSYALRCRPTAPCEHVYSKHSDSIKKLYPEISYAVAVSETSGECLNVSPKLSPSGAM